MKNIYSVDAKRDGRRMRPEIVILWIVTVILLAIGLIVIRDIRKNPTVIDDTGNTPIAGVVQSASSDFKEIIVEDIGVQVPANWTLSDKERRTRYDPYTIAGTTGDDAGRSIDIYIDNFPTELPITRIQLVDINENSLSVGDLSPQCRSFTKTGDEEVPAGNPYPSKWNDIDFICKTSQISSNIAALDDDEEFGIKLGEEGKERDYLFVITDHGADPTNSYIENILESVRLVN